MRSLGCPDPARPVFLQRGETGHGPAHGEDAARIGGAAATSRGATRAGDTAFWEHDHGPSTSSLTRASLGAVSKPGPHRQQVRPQLS